MDFGGRLKLIRGDLKQEDFARMIGCSKSTYGNWERGSQYPNAEDIANILKAFPDINATWLLIEEGPMRRSDLPVSADHLAHYAATEEIEQDYVMVPRYDVKASAGGGAVIQSEQVVDYLAFKSEWVKNSLGISKDHLALISVLGDSMEPTLSNGDLILIDLRATHIQDNAIYVLSFDSALMVKRIQQKLDRTVIVKSDNAVYEPEIITPDKVEQLTIVGRVVWCGRRM
jgi:phage repressor protein C with HTH and peptisase S24 domain